MKKSVVINIFLVLTAALLFFGSTYLIPTLLGTAIFSISLYFLSKIKSIKVVSVNLLILFIALFAIESFLISADTLKKFKKRNNKQIFTIIDRDTKKEINKSKSYIKILHEKLGYGPVPNAIINSKKIKEGKVVYDVDYTIDKKGHRIASNSAINKKFKKSVLFFGCSFTYGEGVKDNQSLPYVFNLKTNSKYNVANFGFSGYGVQQMLTILENDRLCCTINPNRIQFPQPIFYS